MSRLLLGWDSPEGRASLGFNIPQAVSRAPQLVSDSSDQHMLCIAPTGAGKSRDVAIPNLLEWSGPAIVLDIKGELASTTARYRERVLGQRIVVIDPWHLLSASSDGFNPLDVLAGEGDMPDAAYRFAALMAPPEGTGVNNEQFWNERAESLIAGILSLIAEDEPPGTATLKELWNLINEDETGYELARRTDGLTSKYDFARRQIGGYLFLKADVTKAGIIATAMSYVRIFGTPTVQAATERTTFDLAALRDGAPMTIYFVVPPHALASHASLMRLWFAAILSVLLSRRTRPTKPTLLLIDEFAQLGDMPQVVSAITLARSYGVRCLLLLQSLAQLRHRYPVEHQTILENCGTIMTFGHTLRTMSRDMSDALGDISTEAMAGLGEEEAALKLRGAPTRIVRRLNYINDPMMAGRAAPNRMFEATIRGR